MPRRLGPLLLIAAAALAAACDRDSAAADEILDQIERDDFRNSYDRAPRWDRRLRTEASPHGYWIDIYVNETMSDAIAAGVPIDAWPQDSLVVAEAWTTEDDEGREFLLVMAKSDPATNAWSWYEWRGEDDLIYAAPEVSQCVRCHEAGEDLVRSFELPPIIDP